MPDMKKILLIEDNEDVRINTAEILQLSNYEVILAKDGKSGVEAAIKHHPDLILCDIVMPELDGYGVLHAIHRNKTINNIPFIFLSAKSERLDLRKGMDLGADDYITKPFTGTELLNAVDSRLKKMEMLKTEWDASQENNEYHLPASTGKELLLSLVHDRNINKFKKKQIIYNEGNHPNRLYYVVKGSVKAWKTNDSGKELVTELYRAGDFLGHIALLQKAPYNDTAEALEETELAIIPREDFEQLLYKNMEVAKQFISLLANNIADKENQLLGFAYNSLRKKVAEALLHLQKIYQNNKEEKCSIEISRDSLAAIAGTATESLIRTLGDFKTEKLIDMQGTSITILNEKKLSLLIN